MTSALSPDAAMPSGPKRWPPKTAWPAAVHTGVAAIKSVLSDWKLPAEAPPVLVAVSGGADSLALAVLAAETQRTTRLRFGALSFDHGLQEITEKVTRRTAAICQAVGLSPVVTRRLDITAAGEGIEAAARRSRYAAFVRGAHEAAAAGVFTAHTANDQAEQVLLGLARGSGLRSIAGIRQQRTHELPGFEPLRIGRPMLQLTRTEAEEICAWAGISFWDDPMNHDISVARIRVRKNLLPAFMDPDTGLGTGVFSGLTNTARLAADDAAVLEDLAHDTYQSLVAVTSEALHFSLRELRELPPAVLRRVLAIAVQHFGAPHPTMERLQAIQELIFPPVGRASSAGPIQVEGHVSLYRQKAGQEYAKLLVIPSHPRA